MIELPDWSRHTVALIAGGSSLTDEQCCAVSGLKTIGVNDAYRRARLDILYACDGRWWDYHYGVPEYDGIKITQDKRAAKKFGLVYFELCDEVLCKNPEYIAGGGNSGYQAINVAYHLGARRMLLLGYDMRGPHWFKDRPDRFKKNSPFDVWIKNFDKLAAELEKEGVEVINCSPGSALTCFKQSSIYDELASS